MTDSRIRIILGVALLALSLTVLFWLPLWQGGGFIGGDVYSYYMPQKVFFAEQLDRGNIPLWNSLRGHGNPLVAESQTGPFYPFHLLFYRLLDVNSAYNANHVLHYLLAFVFTAMYARALSLPIWSALLAALTFTYAWFPPRSCWEWAIIGGAWMPLALWCVEKFLTSRRWRYAFALSLVLALQMLAGHYNLAFITQLTLLVYIPARLWLLRPARLETSTTQLEASTSGTTRPALILAAAVGFGFATAAVQLLPTWELKQLSQRATTGDHHQLEHGSIPAWYWSQATAWNWSGHGKFGLWYSPLTNRDAELLKSVPDLGARTNQVEAHLYFGLIPLGLAIIGLIRCFRSKDGIGILWFILGLGALIHTSGWLLPVTRHLPGLNFFQGPGRFGIVTTLAIAVLAGKGLERFRSSSSILLGITIVVLLLVSNLTNAWLAAETANAFNAVGVPHPLFLGSLDIAESFLPSFALFASLAAIVALLRSRAHRHRSNEPSETNGHPLLCGLMLATVLCDFWLVSRLVTYSPMTDSPPILHLEASPVRRLLAEFEGEPRLWAPGGNFATVLGVAATPSYFTFGPAAYSDPDLQMPTDDTARQIDWLLRAGVTHILTFEPLDKNVWPVELLWQGFDPLLIPAGARRGEPCFLYRFRGGRGRAAFADSSFGQVVRGLDYQPQRIAMDVDSPSGGRLILTDLWYPGWEVTIDDQPVEPIEFERMYRAVNVPAGQHTVVWTYRPGSVYWGATASISALVLMGLIALVRMRVAGQRGQRDKESDG